MKGTHPEQLTGVHLYLDIAKSGYLFHAVGNVMLCILLGASWSVRDMKTMKHVWNMVWNMVWKSNTNAAKSCYNKLTKF